MSAAAILERCRAAGVTLHAAGDRLKVTAPRPPSADLLDELRRHKAELLAALQREVQPPHEAMLEDLAERAAIIGEYADTQEAWADAEGDAVRLVQCRTCAHFAADATADMGTCAVDGPALSRSPRAWPHAPRYCTLWVAVPSGPCWPAAGAHGQGWVESSGT